MARIVSVDDQFNLPPSVKVDDTNLPPGAKVADVAAKLDKTEAATTYATPAAITTAVAPKLDKTEAAAAYLTVLVHNGTAYPARPANAPAGLVRYVGNVAPTTALAGDEWLDTSAAAPAADTTAPSAVTNLTAGTPTTTTVSLTWTAATDAVGVTGYEYSSNGTTYTTTGSTGTTYTVTGLTAGTAYTLYIRAFDAAGNKGPSASVTATTTAESTTTYTNAVLADAPLLYYAMSEPAGTTTVTSTGSNTLALTAADVTFGAASLGADATAATFSGTSGAGLKSTTNISPLASATSLSFEMLVKQTGGTSGTAIYHQSILEYFPSLSGNATLKVGNSTAVEMKPEANVVIGTAYHMAFTWDGSNLRAYKNGSLVKTVAHAVAPVGTGSAPFSLGSVGFIGSIAGLAIYKNKVLTPERILAHAQAAGKA